MKNLFTRLLKDESGGGTAIEYGLIAVLIGVAIIGAARTAGSQVGAAVTTVTNQVGSSGSGTGGTTP
ncbi:MAG TPA: Flp family type IVb pilin [Hyphomicrobiaceae bacterium]|jgi:pilus assembly protein Flp/PilA|nr:Flp family type IVb pilin [Hyphomicrobiaceae bacterium]